MGGVTGVGTYPEYANHGLMQDLIIVACGQHAQNKQVDLLSLSLQYPLLQA